MSNAPDDTVAFGHLGALALDLVGATAAAAVACHPWIGRGDKHRADAAAVDAMRSVLASVPGSGSVVVGEGEKDEAPMLYVGEVVGTGLGPAFDLAVDPLEGTNLCATGAPGAITVIGAGPRGSLAPVEGYYMAKLVVGRDAAGTIDIDEPVELNLRRIAAAMDRPIESLRVAALARPRNEDLIRRVRSAGAGVVEIRDGDVMAAVAALVPGTGIDVAAGIGGTPEGVITACAVVALGGDMQGRLAPQSETERATVQAAGQLDRVYTLGDLVTSPDVVFAASGVTGSDLLSGVRPGHDGFVVASLLATGRTGLLRVSGSAQTTRTQGEAA